ncbi:MAG: hypothetical protein WBR23_01810 [Candidatus Dormiibacterota bacterium]
MNSEDKAMRDQSPVSNCTDSSIGPIIWAACGTLVLAAIVISGLFVVRASGFTGLQTATAAAPNAGTVQLTIVTNAGPQHDWPAYSPASFAIPANQAVTISVINLDGSTPLPSSLRSYAQVKGVVGASMSVDPIRIGHPKASAGQARQFDALNAGAVSHTFSIPALGINVPLLGAARTSFTIRITKPGTYGWECFDPCGSGASGLGAPMGVTGYMAGTVTVSAA